MYPSTKVSSESEAFIELSKATNTLSNVLGASMEDWKTFNCINSPVSPDPFYDNLTDNVPFGKEWAMLPNGQKGWVIGQNLERSQSADIQGVNTNLSSSVIQLRVDCNPTVDVNAEFFLEHSIAIVLRNDAIQVSL